MKTKLINYRTYNLDKSKVIPIDRRSGFGNPFIEGIDGNRKEVVEKYSNWLIEWIYYKKEIIINGRSNKWIIEHLKELSDSTVGCWCTPLPCHGDVIIGYLEGSK